MFDVTTVVDQLYDDLVNYYPLIKSQGVLRYLMTQSRGDVSFLILSDDGLIKYDAAGSEDSADMYAAAIKLLPTGVRPGGGSKIKSWKKYYDEAVKAKDVTLIPITPPVDPGRPWMNFNYKYNGPSRSDGLIEAGNQLMAELQKMVDQYDPNAPVEVI
jgi:hypothetical protein